MKKIIMTLLVFVFMTTLMFAQWDIEEGFEGATFPPADWTVINNNGGSEWAQMTSAVRAHTGEKLAYCMRESSSSNPNDDWLITPQVSIQSGDSLIFWARGWSDLYDETFNVKLSTTSNAVADFTVTLGTGIITSAVYAKFEYDLSSYNGQNVYLAIQYVSTFEFALLVDDVTVGQGTQSLIGDFNSDGYVDAADLQLLGDHWHFIDTDPGWDALYDLVPDNIIDAADLQVFGDHWHEGTPPTKSGESSKDGKGPNEDAGIVFDLDATTYSNQNDTIMTIPGIGDYIRLDVYAINVNNFDTYEFEVNYNQSQLDYITATATNPITYEPNILTNNGGTAIGWMIDNSTPGVLSIAYTLAGTDTLEAPEGEGLVADIVFRVLSTVGDSLTFGDVHFYDYFGVMDIITDKGIAIFLGAVSIDDNGFDTTFEETKLENYPNPFYLGKTGTTTISFSLPYRNINSPVIKIFNINGQLVKQFHANNSQSSIVWNGTDENNQSLSSGVYLYKLTIDDEPVLIKKMVLMK